jgi:hypothetical protein
MFNRKLRMGTVLATTGILLATLSMGAVALFGQGHAGSIRGTVTDPSGAVVPGAAVRATNMATGVATSTVTTSAGLYNLASLRPGVYAIEVTKPGFKTLVRENVTVALGVTTALDMSVEVGQAAQTVTVNSAAPLIENSTSELTTSVNPASYLDLPMNANGGRSAEAFVDLAPGVYGNNSFNYNANGGQIFSRQVKAEGLDISNVYAQPGDTSKFLTFPPDAVQEFTYVTLTPSAEYGNNMSGTIEYTVKSGTNRLHGSAYEFYVGNALNARNFLQSDLTRFNQNEYGFTLGGPVYLPKIYDGRNKTFFFFNFNGFSTRSAPQNHYITIPTAKEHSGDFSDYPFPIYDPATTTRLPGGGYTRTQFPGNIIPPDRINAIAANLATGMPLPPESAGLTNNYFQKSISNNFFKNQTFKIDEVLNTRHRFSFIYNHSYSESYTCDNPCFDPATTKQPSVAGGVQNTGYYPFIHNFDHLNYDYTISPTTLFHTTVGLERWSFPYHSDNVGPDWEDILGIKNIGHGSTFPFIGWGSFAPTGNGPATTYNTLSSGSGAASLIGTVPQITESFTLVRGRQTIKLGGDQQWYQNEYHQTNDPAFNFSALTTDLPTSPQSTGNPFASFLLGDVYAASRSVWSTATTSVYWYYGFYAQDDIRWSRKLMINVGLRYELFEPWYDKHDVLSTVDLHTPNPGCGGCPGAMIFAGTGPGKAGTRKLAPPLTKDNFTPRIGFAYALKPNLAVRAGYAILDEMPGIAGSNGNRWSNLGYTAAPFFQSPDNGVTPAFTLNDGFPAFTPPPFISPTYGIGANVSYYDANASHPGQLQQWHFNVQNSFRPNWLLDVGYVGSKGTYLYTGAFNLNQTDSKYLSLGSLLTDSIYDPAVVAEGFKPPYPGFTGSLAQALRPYPQYLEVGAAGSGLLSGVQAGNSTYHALQVKLEHRFSAGLYLLSSYTWQKWLTNAPSTAGGGGTGGGVSTAGGFEGVSVRDQYHRSLEHALGPVPPQELNIAFNYELPFGAGKRFASGAHGIAGALVKGWQLNGILTYGSGTPLTVIVNNTLPIFNGINFPNIVPGVSQIMNHHITDPRLPGQLYLNPAAFSAPAPFTYGNAPQTLNVRGFANLNENLGLMKRTYFAGEKANLELRFEAFNAFNRHTWNGYDFNLSDPNFGAVTGVSNGRQAQVAAKIVF